MSNTECLDSDGSLESEARVDLTRIVQEEDPSSLATSDREITINFFGCCPTALRVANPSPRPSCTVFIECKEDGPARIPPPAWRPLLNSQPEGPQLVVGTENPRISRVLPFTHEQGEKDF